MNDLFIDADNHVWSDSDIDDALLAIGADQCDTLFIHSDIVFGKPVRSFNRSELVALLFERIVSLGVNNIVVPTFTYSFCNGEDYDIVGSRSCMGVLSEYVRKQEGRYRTEDPLLSVSVPETLQSLFHNISIHSLGEGSALDILHHMENVKFLFFGAEMADCFTYVHYVEKMLDVPYRFDMPFAGNVTYLDGHTVHRVQYMHTQCSGVRLLPKYIHFESEMEEKGFLKKKRIADRYVACISERDAYREISRKLKDNIFYFLAEPFRKENLIRQYTYDINNGRITHC